MMRPTFVLTKMVEDKTNKACTHKPKNITQKHALSNNKKKTKATTKPWFSRLLRHPARKRSGSILVHNTQPDPHGGRLDEVGDYKFTYDDDDDEVSGRLSIAKLVAAVQPVLKHAEC